MMMNRKKPASLHEAIRNLWKIRIMLEKNYTEKLRHMDGQTY